MQSALKDLWPRYKTMQGYRVLRKAGWDTHGLPVEMTADKELGFKSKQDVVKYGEQKYIDHCRKTVFRYKETWEAAIRRSGRFIDLENAYATFRPYYIQSDWWTLKQAWNLELEGEARERVLAMGQSPKYLYRDYRIMAYSPRTGTTLSNFEVAQGYKDVTDITLYVKFRVKGEANTYLTAWTTTPWTSAVEYGSRSRRRYRILYGRTVRRHRRWQRQAKNGFSPPPALAALEPMIGKHSALVGTMMGKELEGVEYEPMWEWLEEFSAPAIRQQHKQTASFVIVDPYVTTADGTGLVHLAYYGEDDFRILRKNGIPLVLAVDSAGLVADFVKPYAGRWFREEGLDVDILKALKAKNLLIDKEKYEHSLSLRLPHRQSADVLPSTCMVRSHDRVEGHDDQSQSRRSVGNPSTFAMAAFGNWLENVQDWNVTRERYWGSPLPVWRTEEGDESDLLRQYRRAFGSLSKNIMANLCPKISIPTNRRSIRLF